MKRSVKKKRRLNRKQGPSVCAWCLLVLGWFSVIPLYLLVSHPAVADGMEAIPSTAKTETGFTQPPSQLSVSLDSVHDAGSLRGDGPTVLIYHTHTNEAYYKTTEDEYDSSSDWRTKDTAYNVVAVGEELKTILETQYGFSVLHDTTDHEPPKLSTAYDRSLETMMKYKDAYPSIVLFIDLHRDAYRYTDKPCDYISVNGEECARLMFVVGKGEKYDEKPFFTSNLALAESISDKLNEIEPNFARKSRIKAGRYNQHVAPNCLLVEVGHNANTLDQAKSSMKYLAECIALSFRSGRINSSDWVPN